MAVTKTVPVAAALALARLGVVDFGENRPASLVLKREEYEASGAPPARWHMIGHVQTNKLRRALPSIDVLHSLDRWSLLEALEHEVPRARPDPLPTLIEVNVSGEASKGGFAPEELPAVLDRACRSEAGSRAVAVAGLMTMAPLGERAEDARPVFRSLRELRDEARRRGYLETSELSMGMSLDHEVAVEEGATLVRVGTMLFTGPS